MPMRSFLYFSAQPNPFTTLFLSSVCVCVVYSVFSSCSVHVYFRPNHFQLAKRQMCGKTCRQIWNRVILSIRMRKSNDTIFDVALLLNHNSNIQMRSKIETRENPISDGAFYSKYGIVVRWLRLQMIVDKISWLIELVTFYLFLVTLGALKWLAAGRAKDFDRLMIFNEIKYISMGSFEWRMRY